MTDDGAPPRAARPLFDWKAVLGILLSIGLLYWVFRDIDIAEVAQQIRRADPLLLALAAMAATAVFPLRALRWRPLLQPIHGSSRFRNRFAATAIGFMTNNLLPARVGEFARAFALSRLEPVSVSASFGSLVIERMFDGIVVVGLLLVAVSWPGFPDLVGLDYGRIAVGLGILFLVGFSVLGAMVAWPERSVRFFERVAARVLPRAVRRPVVDTLEAFLTGLAAVRDWRLVARALAWSLAVWGVGAFGFWLGFLAFDIQVPFVAAVFLQSVIALAVSLPSAPGFFGLFEAGARIGLVDIWGVQPSSAVAFALGFHLAGFIPITLIGLYYVWRLRFSWREIEQSEDVVESAVEAGASRPPVV